MDDSSAAGVIVDGVVQVGSHFEKFRRLVNWDSGVFQRPHFVLTGPIATVATEERRDVNAALPFCVGAHGGPKFTCDFQIELASEGSVQSLGDHAKAFLIVVWVGGRPAGAHLLHCHVVAIGIVVPARTAVSNGARRLRVLSPRFRRF